MDRRSPAPSCGDLRQADETKAHHAGFVIGASRSLAVFLLVSGIGGRAILAAAASVVAPPCTVSPAIIALQSSCASMQFADARCAETVVTPSLTFQGAKTCRNLWFVRGVAFRDLHTPCGHSPVSLGLSYAAVAKTHCTSTTASFGLTPAATNL
jgi:hypothetical protein